MPPCQAEEFLSYALRAFLFLFPPFFPGSSEAEQLAEARRERDNAKRRAKRARRRAERRSDIVDDPFDGAAEPPQSVNNVLQTIQSRNVLASTDLWVRAALLRPCSRCGRRHADEEIEATHVGLVVELKYACRSCRTIWRSTTQTETTETNGYGLNAAYSSISISTGIVLPKLQEALDILGVNKQLSATCVYAALSHALPNILSAPLALSLLFYSLIP